MGLNLDKLENIKHKSSHIIARCPACDEIGNDHKGDHLFINDNGQFGCVLYPGHEGQQHRQRIFELVGIQESPNRHFENKKSPSTPITKSDDDGHERKILELVRVKHNPCKYSFEIKKPASALLIGEKIIKKDILGHLGHLILTYARKDSENNIYNNRNITECEKPVPTVPKTINGDNLILSQEVSKPECQGNNIFTPKEEQLLKGFSQQTKETVLNVKQIFGSKCEVIDSYSQIYNLNGNKVSNPLNTEIGNEKTLPPMGCLACLIDIGRVMPCRGGKPLRNLLNVVNSFTSLNVKTLEDFNKITKSEAKEIINFLGIHHKDTILHFINKNNTSQTEANGT